MEQNLVGHSHQDLARPAPPKIVAASEKLKITFSPVRATKGQYRVLTHARTKNEKFWGCVEWSDTNSEKWYNSRNDGRTYRNRELAARDLIDRRGF